MAQARTHEATITNENRSTTPKDERFSRYIGSHWAPEERPLPLRRPSARFAAERRERLSSQFPGRRLVIEAGVLKQRSNDTFYQFRAHSAFSHLTGWGSDAQPGSVLVMTP